MGNSTNSKISHNDKLINSIIFHMYKQKSLKIYNERRDPFMIATTNEMPMAKTKNGEIFI